MLPRVLQKVVLHSLCRRRSSLRLAWSYESGRAPGSTCQAWQNTTDLLQPRVPVAEPHGSIYGHCREAELAAEHAHSAGTQSLGALEAHVFEDGAPVSGHPFVGADPRRPACCLPLQASKYDHPRSPCMASTATRQWQPRATHPTSHCPRSHHARLLAEMLTTALAKVSAWTWTVFCSCQTSAYRLHPPSDCRHWLFGWLVSGALLGPPGDPVKRREQS